VGPFQEAAVWDLLTVFGLSNLSLRWCRVRWIDLCTQILLSKRTLGTMLLCVRADDDVDSEMRGPSGFVRIWGLASMNLAFGSILGMVDTRLATG
jgi:hypothetical protein